MRKILTGLIILLAACSIPAHSQNNVVSDAIEFAFLKDMFDSLNGAAWTTKTNWPTAGNWPTSATSAQFGTWFGITVANGDISQINFNANNIVGKLPTSIGQLTKLTRLAIQSNQINGKLPSTIGNLSALTYFSLAFNQISGQIPASIGNLANLQVLNLSSNWLSGSIPPTIGSLHNVQQVFIENNSLSGTIPDEFDEMYQLRDLRLTNNLLSGPLPPTLGRSGSPLFRILVTNNKLSGQIPSTYSYLTAMTHFYLDRNEFSGEVPSFIGTWTALVNLVINNNKFSGELPPSLSNCTGLWILSVGFNRFSGAFPAMTSPVNTAANDNYFTSIPSALLSNAGATSVSFQNNELGQIPNFGTHVNKGNLVLNVSNNRLDFFQLERQEGQGIKTLTQVPQRPVRDQATQTVVVGSPLVITAKPLGSGTSLTWEKLDGNGSTWSAVTGNDSDQDAVANTYTRTSAVLANAGSYRWRTISSLVAGTIYSEPTIVKTAEAFKLDNWAFQYKYDGRRRMTHKKVPGADWVYMVYDARDRLVMTQDGEQRKTNKWTVTKYDALNRPVLTAVYTHTSYQSQEDMSGLISTTLFAESYTTSTFTKYTNTVFPTAPLDILTVTYYDNYDFTANRPELAYKSDELTGLYKHNNVANTSFPAIKGLPTGGITRVLDQRASYVEYLRSATYYDNRHRVVQTVSENYDAGFDRTSSTYEFTGQVTATKTSHTVNNIKWKNTALVAFGGNSIFRTQGSSTPWGVSGASSVQSIPASTAGWAAATVTETNSQRMWGLADTDPDKLQNSIDYAFYLNLTSLQIYENGVFKYTVPGASQPGDRLKIKRAAGGAVTYHRNNEQVYASGVSSSTVLYVDVTMGSNVSTIAGLTISTGETAPQTTQRSFEYDHSNRLVRTYHSVNGAAAVVLLENEYNEVGQLTDKKLHKEGSSPYSQSVDYRYNIRGWLTSLNGAAVAQEATDENDADSDSKKDLFGMNLLYNTTAAGMSNTEMYNGNISAMQWRTNLGLADVKMRGYTFSYDPMNRLLDAAPRHYTGTWAANTLNREGTLTYDLNGNIRTLQRTQAAGTSMDNLSYDYGTGTNSGNRLRNVKDTSFDEEGFKDNTGGSDDYVYDCNGNMTADGNKGIGIGYNLLNLPNIVVNAAGDRIFYIYDAGGRKLSQVLANSGGAQRKVTDYHGEYIYENDTLKFASHEEGRIIMTGAAPEYQYHLKDHLGNVRMTYTTKDETVESKATMETPNQAAEYGQFINYDKARMINHVVYDHTYNGQTPPNGSAYAVRLNGSAKERIGLAKSLSVMPGDRLKIEVFAKYYEPPQSGNPGLFATLMAAIIGGTQPGGTFVDGTGYATSASTTVPYGNALYKGSETAGAPKAYLNWLIFDRKHNVIASQSSFKRITTAAKEDTTDVAHERLAPQGDYIEIKEPGYAYIWISNENEVPVEVYFDDFRVEHIKSPVVESQDYYPFGLTYGSYQREDALSNQYKYNGKELQNELNLGWLDYGARMYQPDIGRWGVVDPLAEKYTGISPYPYVANSPIRLRDPDGRKIVVYYQEEKKHKDGTTKLDKDGNAKMRTRGVKLSYDKDGNIQARKGGNNEFVSKAVASLNYVKAGDKAGVIDAAMKSDTHVRVNEISWRDGGTKYQANSNTISWDPASGMKIARDGGTTTGQIQSPAMGLYHELGHAVNDIYDPTAFSKRGQEWGAVPKAYGKTEEWFVINAYESPTARNLGEPTRTNHGGAPTNVESPTYHIK